MGCTGEPEPSVKQIGGPEGCASLSQMEQHAYFKQINPSVGACTIDMHF